MADKPAANILVDQKQALDLFLDSLLRETETLPETKVETAVEEAIAPAVEIENSPSAAPVEAPVAEIVAPAVETSTVVETVDEVSLQTENVVVEESRLETASPLPDYAVPEWANAPFQAMLFKAGGLKLAVPLVELSGVIEWPEKINEMPGHADFYLGLVTYLDRQVPVVDTARLVLPDEHLARLSDAPEERVTRIVLIDEGRWGLACDSVAEVITLAPDDVRWRTSRSHHPWLAGTVVQHMCALIDGSEFARRLQAGDA